MLYHAEVVIPPVRIDSFADDRTADLLRDRHIERSLDEIEAHTPGVFHDGCHFGGRFAGIKRLFGCDPVKFQRFCFRLLSARIQTSRTACLPGPWLEPESQQARIDAKWNEMSPSGEPVACPIFSIRPAQE